MLLCGGAHAAESAELQALRAEIEVQIAESKRLQAAWKDSLARGEPSKVSTAKFRLYQAQVGRVAELQTRLPPVLYKLRTKKTEE